MPGAVLLDLFDTVVASDWTAWRTTLSRLLGVDGHALTHAFSTTRVARNTGRYPDEEGDMRAVIEAVGIDDPPADLIRSCASASYEFTRDGIDLYDDVVPTLAALRDAGIRTALVSNCDHFARHVVDRLELRDRFDAVLLSYEVRAKKPDPVIYRAALAAVGEVMPGEAVFVDDHTSYCDGARDLGIATCLIIRPDAEPPEGVSVDANGHEVIADLRSLARS